MNFTGEIKNHEIKLSMQEKTNFMTIYSYKMQYGLYMEGKQPGKCCASYIKSRLSVPIITVIPCNILSYSCIKGKDKEQAHKMSNREE